MTATAPAASSSGAYRIVSRYHVNQWDDALQATVPGWIVKALWFSTGTVLPVFVPDASYTAANVDTLVRAAGAKDEEIHQLGS